MSLIQSIGSPFHFGHAATNATSDDEAPAEHPLPVAGRHRLDRSNDKQWRIQVPPRPREQR